MPSAALDDKARVVVAIAEQQDGTVELSIGGGSGEAAPPSRSMPVSTTPTWLPEGLLRSWQYKCALDPPPPPPPPPLPTARPPASDESALVVSSQAMLSTRIHKAAPERLELVLPHGVRCAPAIAPPIVPTRV
jgi:hypothetical protein